jgi:hypothetical protein
MRSVRPEVDEQPRNGGARARRVSGVRGWAVGKADAGHTGEREVRFSRVGTPHLFNVVETSCRRSRTAAKMGSGRIKEADERVGLFVGIVRVRRRLEGLGGE